MKIFLAINKLEISRDISYSIKTVIEQFGHKLITFDGFSYDPDDELINVNDLIAESDMVIADLSKADNSVMYQVGMAKTFKIPMIIVSQGFEIPSDLKGSKIIIYERDKLKATLINPLVNFLSQKDLGRKIKKIVLQDRGKKSSKQHKHTIFISYNRNDKEILKRLLIHLKPFEKEGLIELWEDTKIKAGEKWEEEIKKALDRCLLAILLISADFLASDFIIDNELPPLLRDAENKGKKILPVITKPCLFNSYPNLSKFQAINDPNTPLSKMRSNGREEIFVKIAKHIENELKLKIKTTF